jgi:hypothetical protein
MKFGRRVLALVAVIIGASGMLYGAISAFVQNPEKIPGIGIVLSRPAETSLFLLGLLLVIVGVEVQGILFGLEGQLDVVQKSSVALLNLAKSSPDPFILEGETEIYERASSLVSHAQRYVRAVTFRDTHREEVPMYWNALVKRIDEAGKARSPVDFRLVYGYSDVDNMRAVVPKHRDYFKNAALESSYVPRFLGSSVGVDILVVDDAYILIALPVLAADPSVRRAIMIADADNLGSDVVSWFDTYIWNKADRSL